MGLRTAPTGQAACTGYLATAPGAAPAPARRGSCRTLPATRGRQETRTRHTRAQCFRSSPDATPSASRDDLEFGSEEQAGHNASKLGGWSVGKSVRLKESTDGVWRVDLLLKPGPRHTREQLQYKFVLKRANGHFLIEDGKRRVLPDNLAPGESVVIQCQATWVLADKLQQARKHRRTRTPTPPPPPVPTAQGRGMLDAFRTAFTAFQHLGRRSVSRSPSPNPARPHAAHSSPAIRRTPGPMAADPRRSLTPSPRRGPTSVAGRQSPLRLTPQPARGIRVSPAPARRSMTPPPPITQHKVTQPVVAAQPPQTQPTQQPQSPSPTPSISLGTVSPSPAQPSPVAGADSAAADGNTTSSSSSPFDFATQMLAKQTAVDAFQESAYHFAPSAAMNTPDVMDAVINAAPGPAIPNPSPSPAAQRGATPEPESVMYSVLDQASITSSPGGSPAASMDTDTSMMPMSDDTLLSSGFSTDGDLGVQSSGHAHAAARPSVADSTGSDQAVGRHALEAQVALTVVVPRFKCSPGAQLVLCGALPTLGQWKPAKALPLVACDDGVWVGTLQLPVIDLLVGLEAKLVCVRDWKPSGKEGGRSERVRSRDADWEGGDNRVIKIEAGHYSDTGRYLVTLDWSNITPPALPVSPTTSCTLHVEGDAQSLPVPEGWDGSMGAQGAGGRLLLVGNDPLLGSWDVNKGVVLEPVPTAIPAAPTSKRGAAYASRQSSNSRQVETTKARKLCFKGTLQLPLGGVVEGKLVWVDDQPGIKPVWEDGYNRVLVGNPVCSDLHLAWRAPPGSVRAATPRPKHITPARDATPLPKAGTRSEPAAATGNDKRHSSQAKAAAPAIDSRPSEAADSSSKGLVKHTPPEAKFNPYTAQSGQEGFKVDLNAGEALRAARMAAFTWASQHGATLPPDLAQEAGLHVVTRSAATTGGAPYLSRTGSSAYVSGPPRRGGVATLVQFVVPQLQVQLGQTLRIVGSEPELGNWDPEHGLPLEQCEGDMWVAATWLPAGAVVEAKLLLVSQAGPVLQQLPDGRVKASFTVHANSISLNSMQLAQMTPTEQYGPVQTWEDGDNRTFQVVGNHRNLVVCEWSDTRCSLAMLDTVRCEFVVRNKVVPPGHWLAVMGPDRALGRNKPRHAAVLRWTYGNTWVGHVDLPREVAVQGLHARLLVCSYSDAEAQHLSVETETGDMRFVKALDPHAVVMRAVMNWGDPEETQLYAVATTIPIPSADLPPALPQATTAPTPAPTTTPSNGTVAADTTSSESEAVSKVMDGASKAQASRSKVWSDEWEEATQAGDTPPLDESVLTEDEAKWLKGVMQSDARRHLAAMPAQEDESSSPRSPSPRAEGLASWEEQVGQGDDVLGSSGLPLPPSPPPASYTEHHVSVIASAISGGSHGAQNNKMGPAPTTKQNGRSGMGAASAVVGSQGMQGAGSPSGGVLERAAVSARAQPDGRGGAGWDGDKSPSPIAAPERPSVEGPPVPGNPSPVASNIVPAGGARQPSTPLRSRAPYSSPPPPVSVVPEPAVDSVSLAGGAAGDMTAGSVLRGVSPAVTPVGGGVPEAEDPLLSVGPDMNLPAVLKPGSLVVGGGTAEYDFELIGLDLLIDIYPEQV